MASNNPVTASQKADKDDDTESAASMADDIRQAQMPKKNKKVIHRRVKDWDAKIKEELQNARPVDEMI
eukprot:CAMPEP_0116872300 /NCGR_PEP_ID=MMETSP0463-20121206/3016_1 /TAXON_ID=181622 /ORGANISM="Strombidinopsis sp, Strain SopsisLIS2011" /LENGTH=67 /DNA_ID=CAMNT_0004512315 /DNA_START=871 /DNA_END=1070 /DNA_ORIENTATION=+